MGVYPIFEKTSKGKGLPVSISERSIDKSSVQSLCRRENFSFIRVAGWIASAITIACALILAVDRAAPMRWLFVAWSVANTLWVLYGWGIRSGSVLSSQVVFCVIDVIGLIHYWG